MVENSNGALVTVSFILMNESLNDVGIGVVSGTPLDIKTQLFPKNIKVI